MERVVPALAAHLGTELPGVVDRVAVVDRGEWVEANTVAFSQLIGKIEGPLLEQMLPEGAGLGKATMTLANRWVTTRQLGLLLGFMGQRVLGQYDLPMPGPDQAASPDGDGAARFTGAPPWGSPDPSGPSRPRPPSPRPHDPADPAPRWRSRRRRTQGGGPGGRRG